MEKIISLFQRNYVGDRLVRDEIVPGAEWVPAGEGSATRKWDGTCCLVREGRLYGRYEVKRGKSPPADFEPAPDVDTETGKQQGWRPVTDDPEWRWHREAWAARKYVDGTYELLGPKIQGNPEGLKVHTLYCHGNTVITDVPRTFEGLRQFFELEDVEGIVWHHSDGRMVKIKGKDFGIKRSRKGDSLR